MHCMVAAKKSTKKIFVLSCSSGKLAKSRKFNFLKERCKDIISGNNNRIFLQCPTRIHAYTLLI